jgi:hypothetical protein
MKINGNQIETLAALMIEQRRQYDRTTEVHVTLREDETVRFRIVDTGTDETVLKGNIDTDGDLVP